MNDYEKRLAELERRIALLESKDQPLSPSGGAQPPPFRATHDQSVDLILVRVSNKKYDPENTMLGKYEDHVWFDCDFTLSEGNRSTRAVKGVLQFCDLFGDPRFMINVTINDPLHPGKPLRQPGIGFTYNQFMDDHQWMMVTDLSHMTFKFKPTNVLFQDGTSSSFA